MVHMDTGAAPAGTAVSPHFAWIPELRATKTVTGVSSKLRLRRAVKVIGEGAVAWATAAGELMAERTLLPAFEWPGDGSEEEREAMQRTTEASAIDTLIALYTGDELVLSVASETIEVFGYYLHYDIPLADVMRAVQLGEELLTQLLVDEISAHVEAGQQLATVRELLQRMSSAYTLVANQVRRRYEHESERWHSQRAARRLRVVQQLLDGPDASEIDTFAELGYLLDQPHVAVVLQIGAGAFERVGSANFPTIAARAARALGAPGAPLLVPQGETRAHVWIGSPSSAAVAESFGAESWPAGLQLSVSGVHNGLAGFRRAHAEAIAANRVARLAPQRQITDYGQVELTSLLTADLGRAAEFVTRTLGALSVDDPRIVELRKTLAAYIDAGGGLAETAQRLYVHRNTVAYRLQQIKAVIGPDYDATSVRVAIMLVDELPLLMSVSPRQASAALRDLFPEAGPASRP